MNTIVIGKKNVNLTTFGILSLIVLLVAYYLGSRTGKAKQLKTDPNSSANIKDRLTGSIAAEPLTYPIDNYSIFAERIYIECRGITTDEAAVYAIFRKLRNQSDLLQLIVSFGERGEFWTLGKAGLSEWLYTGMSNSEIKEINSILAANNIKYEF
jgi:hypothetical protein